MSGGTPLADRLLAERPPNEAPDRVELESRLREVARSGQAAWPGVAVPEEELVAHLAKRLPEETPVVQALDALCLDDLYLACACLQGRPEAIAAFEAHYTRQMVLAVEQARIAGIVAEEVVQAAKARLLVGEDDRPPRIAQYTGRGDLSGWLRVVVVREALMRLRGRRREVSVEDGHLERLVEDDADPELAYLKGMYRAEFKEAFGEALAQLDSRDRNVLRYHYLERVNLDRLGAMYQVHRATISRWIARAREQIISDTVAALRRRIQVSDSEFHSLVRLLRSRVDMSVRRLFEDQ